MHCPGVCQYFFDGLYEEGRGAHQVVDGEVQQDEVHGLMQRFVEHDDEDEDRVAEKYDHVAECSEEKRWEDSLGGQIEAIQHDEGGCVRQAVHFQPLLQA